MELFDFIFFCVLIACSITLNILCYNDFVHRYVDIRTENNTMVMIGENYTHNVTGVYIPHCGYFVDTRYEDEKAVELTQAHEQIHEMIHQNQSCGNETCKKHFCGD